MHEETQNVFGSLFANIGVSSRQHGSYHLVVFFVLAVRDFLPTRCLLFDESRLVSQALVPIFSLCSHLLVSFGSVVYAQ
jgi:hypothetical protein